VEVEEWEETFIRVQAIVSIENGSPEVLKSLMLAGRYQVKTDRDGPIGYAFFLLNYCKLLPAINKLAITKDNSFLDK